MALPDVKVVPVWRDPNSRLPYTVLAYPMTGRVGVPQTEPPQRDRRSFEQRAEPRTSQDEQQLGDQQAQRQLEQQHRSNLGQSASGSDRRASTEQRQSQQQRSQTQRQRRMFGQVMLRAQRRTSKEKQQIRRSSLESPLGAPTLNEQVGAKQPKNERRVTENLREDMFKQVAGKMQQQAKRVVQPPRAGQQLPQRRYTATSPHGLLDRGRNPYVSTKDTEQLLRVVEVESAQRKRKDDGTFAPKMQQAFHKGADAAEVRSKSRVGRGRKRRHDESEINTYTSEGVAEPSSRSGEVIRQPSDCEFKSGVRRLPKDIQQTLHSNVGGVQKVAGRIFPNKERIRLEGTREHSGHHNVAQDIWRPTDSVERVNQIETDDVETSAARVFRYPEVRSTREIDRQSSVGRARISLENEIINQRSGETERNRGFQDSEQNIWNRSDTAQRVYQTKTGAVEKMAEIVSWNSVQQSSTGQVPQSDRESLQGTEKITSSDTGSTSKMVYGRPSRDTQDVFPKSMENVHKVTSRTYQSKERIPLDNENEMSSQRSGEPERNTGFQETVQDIWKRPTTKQRVYQTEVDPVQKSTERNFQGRGGEQTRFNVKHHTTREPSPNSQEILQGTDGRRKSEVGKTMKRGEQEFAHALHDEFHQNLENIHRITSKSNHSRNGSVHDEDSETGSPRLFEAFTVPTQGGVYADETTGHNESPRGEQFKRDVRRSSQELQHAFQKIVEDTHRVERKIIYGRDGTIQKREEDKPGAREKAGSVSSIGKGIHPTNESAETDSSGVQRLSNQMKEVFHKRIESLDMGRSNLYQCRKGSDPEDEFRTEFQRKEGNKTSRPELQASLSSESTPPEMFEIVFDRVTRLPYKTAEGPPPSHRPVVPPSDTGDLPHFAQRQPQRNPTEGVGQHVLRERFEDVYTPERDHSVRKSRKYDSYDIPTRLQEPETSETLSRDGTSLSGSRDASIDGSKGRPSDTSGLSAHAINIEPEGIPAYGIVQENQRLSNHGFVQDSLPKCFEDIYRPEREHGIAGSRYNTFDTRETSQKPETAERFVSDHRTLTRSREPSRHEPLLKPTSIMEPEQIVKRDSQKRSTDEVHNVFQKSFEDIHRPHRSHISERREHDPYDSRMKWCESEIAERFVRDERFRAKSQDPNSQRIWSLCKEQSVYYVGGDDVPEKTPEVFNGPEADEPDAEVVETHPEEGPNPQANENEFPQIDETRESLKEDEDFQPNVPGAEEETFKNKREEKEKPLKRTRAVGAAKQEKQADVKSVSNKPRGRPKRRPPSGKKTKKGIVTRADGGGPAARDKLPSWNTIDVSREKSPPTAPGGRRQSEFSRYLEGVKQAAHELRKDVEERAIRELENFRRRAGTETVDESVQTDMTDQPATATAVAGERPELIPSAALDKQTVSVGCNCPPGSFCRQHAGTAYAQPGAGLPSVGVGGMVAEGNDRASRGMAGGTRESRASSTGPSLPPPSPLAPPPLLPSTRISASKPQRTPCACVVTKTLRGRSRSQDPWPDPKDQCNSETPANPFVMFPPSLPPHVSGQPDSHSGSGAVPYGRARSHPVGGRCASRELRPTLGQRLVAASLREPPVTGSACVNPHCVAEHPPVRLKRLRPHSLPRTLPKRRMRSRS